MNALTYSAIQDNFAEMMEKVCHEHAPVIITREDKQAVVLVSLEDYHALEETAYLLRSPANAKRLLESIEELESGRGIEREIFS